MLFVDYKTTYTTSIDVDAPVAPAVGLLHDPTQLMRLNAVIVDVRQYPADPARHTIIDELAVLGDHAFMVYTSRVRLMESGMEVETAAGMGRDGRKLQFESA